MKTRKLFTACMIQVIVLCFLFVPSVWAADPIVIGVPTSTGFLEGKECLKSVQMAVEEINKNWGKQFPGSSIDIYEWTKSTVTPDEWITVVQGEFSLDGEIASGEAYTKTLSGVTHYYWCEEEAIDPYTGSGITYYYFWVKNKTSIPKSRPYR